MSNVVLRCTNGTAESAWPVNRERWENLPEPDRDELRNKVRGMLANHVEITQGVRVDTSTLPVTVDVPPVRPGEETSG